MKISTESGVSIKVLRDDKQTVREHADGNSGCISVISIEGWLGTVVVRTFNDGTVQVSTRVTHGAAVLAATPPAAQQLTEIKPRDFRTAFEKGCN